MNDTGDDVGFRQLDEDGYLHVPGAMSSELLARLRARVEELFESEGEAAGAEFKQEAGCRRLANLVDKGSVFQETLLHPSVAPLVRHVLGDDFKLSSNNARSINAFSPQRQPLHADMGAVADEAGYWVCNTVWMLDDFTMDNGAIRAVPGSHRLGALPQERLQDPVERCEGEILLTGAAGDVLVMNAHLWHAGTENRTASSRTAVHVFYCRGDKPQQQYQKQLVRLEVQQGLSPALRKLLALDDERNDRLSVDVQQRSGFLK